MADKFDATIITGSLDGKELENSIDALVKNVSDKTEKMANGFVQSIDKMKLAMKDFALTQKVSVDVMKEAWRNMSSSFDAMVAAQTNATSGGGKGGSKASGASITELRNNIGVVEAQIQKFEAARQKFISIRDEIEKTARSLSANKKDLALIQKGANVYEFDDFGNKVTVTAEKAKKRIKDLEESLRRLMSERVTIPAPSGEELRKYEELQRKLAQLKESLNKAQAPKTVGDLEKQISAEQQYRKDIELGTQELREQNQLIATQKAQLKDELMTEEEKKKAIEKQNEALERQKAKQLKKDQAPYLENWNTARKMSDVQLDDAEKKLQALRREQEKMQKSGLFNQAKLNEAQQAIDRLSEKIERLRSRKPKTMAEVIGMDENGIDAITAKMKALKQVRLDPNDAKQASQLSEEYARLKRRLAELQGQSIQATHANNYLAQSFGYIRNRIVYALTLGAITNFTKQIYEIRGQYELLERSLGVLVNSFERGSQIFQELNNMAIESPFTLMELAGAAKQLTAYNFSANEVVETTRRLADLSSALGVPMERLTYNLGQIRAQTVLTARDARDFANAGLPIVSSLAEHFTELEGRIVTTGDVYDRMSKKMVSYNDVMSVLNKMTDEGGKFFEFQAKQAETLKVQMNNLTLAWNNFLNEMGGSHQGLLSVFPTALKALLQNWKAIDRVLWSIGITFTLWKGLQMVAIRQQWDLAKATGATAKQMGTLANAFNNFKKSLVSIGTNPWTWIFVGMSAITDLAMQIRDARKATHELNQEIKENASEASESMLKYLNNQGNKSTYTLAKQNKLTSEQGEKAWESIKTQLEQSAMSANSLLSTLMAIPDVNERVKKGFEYAESIQKAQAALQDLKDDTIEVSSDFGWWGMLGEGLVSDLKDFGDDILNFKGSYEELQDLLYTNKGTNSDILVDFKELHKELDTTAESINNFLVAHKIKDPLQMREILERAKVTIKSKNPEIKGELAKIFDIELDKLMAEKTGGALDKNASLWDMFMERMKHNYSSAFQDITDDWVNNKSKQLTKEQKKAVDENLKYFKDSMPFAYDAVKKMVADASKLKIHIGLAFSKEPLTDFQQETNKRIEDALNKNKLLDFGSKSLLPNSNEDLHKWAERLQGDIESIKKENADYKRDDTTWSKKQISDNNTQIQQRKNLLDLYNQLYEKEKKNKGRKKDEILDALKKEIELIKKAQSEYETLTKKGASSADALASAQSKFGKTINLLNSKLSHWGLPTIDLRNIIKGDPNKTLAFFEKVKKVLESKGLSNVERMKAVEVVIDEFDIKAKTFNLDNITKSLNSELGKLKDEYELSVSLDANPELGNFFASMFDVDLDSLPRSITEYEQRITDAINKAIKDRHDNLQLDSLRLTEDDINVYRTMAKNGELNPMSLTDIENAYKTMHDLRVKAAQDVAKVVDGYIREYGDLEAQIIQIDKETSTARLQLNEIYYTEAMRQTTEYLDASNAIEDAARRKKAKAEFDFLKKSSDVERFLTAIDTLTQEDALKIKNKIKQGIIKAFKEGGLTVNQFRKEIKALEDQFTKLTKISSNWVSYLEGGFDALIKKARETGQEVETIGEKIAASGKMDDKDKNYLQSLGSIFGDGNGGKMDITQLMGKFGNNMQGLGKAVSGAGQGMQGAASKFSGAIAIIDTIIKNVHQTIQALGSVIDELDSVRNDENKISNAYWEGFKKFDNYAYSGWENFKNGNIAGAAADTVNSIVSVFNAFSNAKNDKINKQLKESERTVTKLANAYKELEVAVEDAFGVAEIAAERTLIANKKLQLAELKRQLDLEKSRDSKRRDNDRILDLEGQIIDAKNELNDMAKDITETFLGISSVKDVVASMVDNIIDALKSGEDAMQGFSDSWEDMVWNMIKQAVSTQILGVKFNEIFTKINADIQSRGKDIADQIEAKQKDINDHSESSNKYFIDPTTGTISPVNKGVKSLSINGQKLQQATYQDWVEQEKKGIAKLEEQYSQAVAWTVDDLKVYATDLQGLRGTYEETVEVTEAIARELGLTLGDKSQALSALQAGISAITEDTAGALEALLNGISQHIYLNSDVLVEIRDTLQTFDVDGCLGIQAQILLELQTGFQTVNAMRSMMENWQNAAGNGIRVELL